MRIPVFLSILLSVCIACHVQAQSQDMTKRIARTIDIADTDRVESYPPPRRQVEEEQPMAALITRLVLDKKLIAYAADDYALDNVYDAGQLKKDIAPWQDTILIEDSAIGQFRNDYMLPNLEKECMNTTVFKVLEEWSFDKTSGRTSIRVLAMGPLVGIYEPKYGHRRGTRVMYWVKYEDIHDLLKQYEQQDPVRNIPMFIWDDYFSEENKSNR